jgi:hypothetical protein
MPSISVSTKVISSPHVSWTKFCILFRLSVTFFRSPILRDPITLTTRGAKQNFSFSLRHFLTPLVTSSLLRPKDSSCIENISISIFPTKNIPGSRIRKRWRHHVRTPEIQTVISMELSLLVSGNSLFFRKTRLFTRNMGL